MYQVVDMAKDKDNNYRLMGFGHRVYKNRDPRATIIKAACDKLLDQPGHRDPLFDIAQELEEVALNDPYFIERKLYPNVDFYCGMIYRVMDPHENVHGDVCHRPIARLDRPLGGNAPLARQGNPSAHGSVRGLQATRIRAANPARPFGEKNFMKM